MRLGIITDIHEAVDQLQAALQFLDAEGVDQIVTIGDLFESGERIEPTCQLLADAGVIGVWGNHDFGLCHEPEDETRARYSDRTLSFMGTLQPSMEIAGCHFCHIEPWLDPTQIEDLWYYDGMPQPTERLDQIFGAVQNRLLFAGHYHRWLAATPAGITDWRGDHPIRLANDRFFVVVGALFFGDFAILDTETDELTPFKTGIPPEFASP